jgi:hypothetical protein
MVITGGALVAQVNNMPSWGPSVLRPSRPRTRARSFAAIDAWTQALGWAMPCLVNETVVTDGGW